jgi:hypothetical protein
MVHYYSMQAFALAMVVLTPCIEVARWLYRKLVAVAALMLGVFVDMSYATGAFKPSPAPNPSRGLGVLERLAKAPFSHAATGLVLAPIGYS